MFDQIRKGFLWPIVSPELTKPRSEGERMGDVSSLRICEPLVPRKAADSGTDHVPPQWTLSASQPRFPWLRGSMSVSSSCFAGEFDRLTSFYWRGSYKNSTQWGTGPGLDLRVLRHGGRGGLYWLADERMKAGSGEYVTHVASRHSDPVPEVTR